MPTQVTEFKCPACTAPLHFSEETGRLECDYCGSSFTVAEAEAFSAEKEQQAAEAFEKAAAEAERLAAEQAEAARLAAEAAYLQYHISTRRASPVRAVACLFVYWYICGFNRLFFS